MQTRIKYPRTLHLPGSPGATDDDKMMTKNEYDHLMSLSIVVTEKMDGENITLYRDGFHARSLDSCDGKGYRSWIKKFHADMGHMIPLGYRICGEYMFAKH